jgi:hypothetical protein
MQINATKKVIVIKEHVSKFTGAGGGAVRLGITL